LYKPVNPSPITKSDWDFVRKFDGLCFGDNPMQGVFTDSIFVQPELGFAWFAPSGWQTTNNRSMVASYPAKGDAMATLKMADPNVSPKELTAKIKAEAQQHSGLEVMADRDTIIHSYPAYLLRMKTVDKNQEAIVELIWLYYDKDLVFQLTGISTPSLHLQTHQALSSFRKASHQEKQLLKLYELKVVHAQNNETIEKVSQRTGNKLKPDFTAVINNLDVKAQFKDGQVLKIVTANPYVPIR
jgi:predicted Zn-dependent protease